MRMDKREFSRRVLAMEDCLYRVSCGLLREHQDRLDAVQETVVRAWMKVDSLKKKEYFETWLTRILINVCYDMLRARKNVVPLEEIAEQPAPEGTDRELHGAIQRLGRDLRLVVVLHYMEGYKLREIAEILDIPIGTVKTRLMRAKRELREQLEEGEERA